MELATRFEYESLDAETRIVVQQKTGEIRDRIKRTAHDIIEIGERLIDIKQRLGHGRFAEWLQVEFDWSERTAERLIGVADAFKSDKLSDLKLSPSALYALSAPSVPEEARKEAVALSEDGHQVTHAKARQIIADHKPDKSRTPALDAVRAPQAGSRAVNVPILECPEDDTPAYEDESQETEPTSASPAPKSSFSLAPTPTTNDEKNAESWSGIINQFCVISRSIERRGGVAVLAGKWPKARLTEMAETCVDISDLFRQYADEFRRLKR